MLRVQKVTRDSATLSWLKPVNDGGSVIKNYVILKQAGLGARWEEAGTVSGSATSFTVINLKEGREHVFAVYAVNRRGKGDIAETIAPVVPQRSVSKYLYSSLVECDLITLEWTDHRESFQMHFILSQFELRCISVVQKYHNYKSLGAG